MNVKRVLAIILTLCLTLAVFAGCKSDDAPAAKPEESTEAPAETADAPEESAEEASSEGASIVWAGWSGEEEGSKDIFLRMRESYTEKTGNNVDWVGWPWADTVQQLLIRNQGSEKLDLSQVDIGMFPTLAEAGVLVDLNELVEDGYFADNFAESALEVGDWDGKQLGMPWSMASISMVYNPEILAAAGWDNPPTTLEEFEKCLADIVAYDSSIIPYGVATKDATMAGDFAPWLWTFGASIYDDNGNVVINSPEAVECVNWYKDMLAKKYIRMDMSRFDARQMFAQGGVAFYDDAVVAKGTAVSNGLDPATVSEVCSAMLRPVKKAGDTPQSAMWGHMLVVFDKSENKDVAVDFAKHLVSEEVAMDYFENNGMPPVLKEVVESDVIKNDEYVSAFLKSTETARLEETARMANGGEVKNIITEELQAALLDDKTPQDALDAAATRIEQVK